MVYCISVFRRSTKSPSWLLRRANVKGSGTCNLYRKDRDPLRSMSTRSEDRATASNEDREPIDPRGYQLEMLAESMCKNIIVAVGILYLVDSQNLTYGRWTQEAARHTCM